MIEFNSSKGRSVMGKGENTSNHHFPKKFATILTLYHIMVTFNDCEKQGFLTHSHTMTPFDAPGNQAF